MKKCKSKLLMSLCCASMLFAGMAGYATAEPFYKNKTIRIVVGFSAGGGYDFYARLVGRHMEKYIEGKPTIIIQNMPGAGSLIAANYVYNSSAPDGTWVGFIDGGNAIPQLVGAPGVQYDLGKFEYIGCFSDSEVAVISTRFDFDDVEKAFNAEPPLRFGHFGGGSFHTTYMSILMTAMGSNAKLIGGYGGASEVVPAIERGEMDATALAWSTAQPHVERGVLKVIVKSGADKEELKGVPFAQDVTPTERGKETMEVLNGVLEVRRVFVLPPGVPEEAVTILRDAFDKVMQDEEFLSQAQRAKKPTDNLGGADSHKKMMKMLDQPEEVVKNFKAVLDY
ncbi:MAG: tripartite tricarboxylate transporter substrate-binding protein [Desulfopila sp.]|nr:tripartite tricarboxylate transporter substrate-binding protein [Desulfopila sp.]